MDANSAERRRPQAYQIFMLGLCLYVLAALAAEACFQLKPETQTILHFADNVICIAFLLDFSYNLYTAESKLEYMKWGWIDLLSSIPTVDWLRWGRTARIIRALRLLRAVRSTRLIAAHILKRRAEGAFSAAALVSILLIIFSSIAILHVETVETSNIETPEEALWWAFVTMTTVGYGDFYPVTTAGRIIAVGLMVAGVGLFGTFTGFVGSWFIVPEAEEQEHELAALHAELAVVRKQLDELLARTSAMQLPSDGSPPVTDPPS